jgi:hypothetical protein
MSTSYTPSPPCRLHCGSGTISLLDYLYLESFSSDRPLTAVQDCLVNTDVAIRRQATLRIRKPSPAFVN